MTDNTRKPVCAVVGVGPGNGQALARCFSGAGYAVALLARSKALSDALVAETPGSRAYTCDAANAAMVEQVFAASRRKWGRQRR